MSLVTKLISGGPERKTRLHTRRGTPAPMAEIGRIPRLLAQRVRGSYTEPWMARGAIERLAALLRPDMRLLELGSGASTAWYAERVKSVVSIEPDAEWAARTRAATQDRDVQVLVGSIEDLVPAQLAGDDFDVIIVDHREAQLSRVDALAAVGSRAQIVVLDDSDRSEYAAADEVMKEWRAERYVSFRAQPLVPTETTVYLR